MIVPGALRPAFRTNDRGSLGPPHFQLDPPAQQIQLRRLHLPWSLKTQEFPIVCNHRLVLAWFHPSSLPTPLQSLPLKNRENRNFTGDSDIRTAGGNIVTQIDPAANCVVKASSVWGHVQDKLPLFVESGGNGKSKFAGRLNQGGPVLTLHANGGHVSIMPGETAFD